MTAPPRRLESPAALRLATSRWQAAGLSVGLVPTMGALHAGHRSLLRRARVECDRVVATIFVNPAQFRPGEDLERYPRPLEEDLGVCAAEGVDAVLVPAPETVYPPGFATTVAVTGDLAERWEGPARPGHLAGVALVVAKLLVAARADRAYFGDKDAQQCAVVRRLAADLDTGTEIVACPVVRDHDGLALSSRNRYLDPGERDAALAIPAALALGAAMVGEGCTRSAQVLAAMRALLEEAGLDVDYVAVVDPGSLEPLDDVDAGARFLVAARIGTTRLIDTLRPGLDEPPVVPARNAAAPAGKSAAGGRRSDPCSASS